MFHLRLCRRPYWYNIGCYGPIHGSGWDFGEFRAREARPEAIGIKNIDIPDYGEMVDIRNGEEPVFWACGVTPQAVAAKSKPPFMITHAPGHMFITDLLDEDQAVL